MGMVVQHNIAALNSNRQLGINNSALSKNLEKLSSGYRINRAGDDAAGLAISEKMRAQIKGLESAEANAQDGISLVQTAEGALTEVHSMLNRMTELATKAANGTFSDSDRQKYSDEVDNLKEEIDRISQSTNFNDIKLLDGSLASRGVQASTGKLEGTTVAKFEKATATGNAAVTPGTLTSNSVDTFNIDGQRVSIDWTNNDEAAAVYSYIKSQGTWDATNTEKAADKLTDLFNNVLKDNGLTGKVKVTGNAGQFTITSQNETETSKAGFEATSLETANAGKSLGAQLFGKASGETQVNSAVKKYDGKNLTANSTFDMDINGSKVTVTLTNAVKNGDLMKDTADALQTAIQTAVDKYNTQNGLTVDKYDGATGLTGLKSSEFAVTAQEDGSFKVQYNGTVADVNVKFADKGYNEVAKNLGLVDGAGKNNKALQLQIGETDADYQKVNVQIKAMDSKSLGLDDVDISDTTSAGKSIDVIKSAIDNVSKQRGNLGALQNRLEHTINSLNVSDENLTAAESRIRDTDMAKEMMAYTQNNVLTQAAQSMLAQANQKPQAVLSLLQ